MIRGTLEAEDRKKPDEDHALSVIEFWRDRATSLNTVHQDLSKPEVEMLRSVLSRSSEDSNATSSRIALEKFDYEMTKLARVSGEAKDNVKFLNTLERQFKNLQSNNFTTIEKTLPSLLKGLKVVFIISRHFKSDERISHLLIIVSKELCQRVKELLDLRKVFTEIEQNPNEALLETAAAAFLQARGVLHLWKSLFEKTKESLEEEGGDRWDFDQKPIKERPEYMMRVLDSLREVIEELKKLVALLGPQLKAVTGGSDKIDDLLGRVKGLARVFLGLKFDPFEKANAPRLKQKLAEYSAATKDIQEKTMRVIESTFADLRSSDAAFELLQKFANLQTLAHVQEQLHKRYSNVLTTYQRELSLNKEIFEHGRPSRAFAKSQPPLIAVVAWKRTLLLKVKAPMLKFVKVADEWNSEELRVAKDDYRTFAKQLDAFEKEKLENWMKSANDRALRHLKQKVLIQTGRLTFKVNFPEDFKVLLSEAKKLDALGFQLPKTILNIALQEHEYYRYADSLSRVINEFHNTVGQLSDIEQQLFAIQLRSLTDALSPALNSFNLNTLGIYDFLASFKEHLKHFVEMKNKVDEKCRMIEDILFTIEETRLIDESNFEKLISPKAGEFSELDTLAKFFSKIQNHIEVSASNLSEKYKKIGETMLPQIESVIHKRQTGQNMSMRFYYSYWERRIYNSLVKMVLRGLISFKMLLGRPNHRPVPLFHISTEFNYLKVITIPHQNEIRVTLNNLLKILKEAAIYFPRWKDGTCHVYGVGDDGFEGEEAANFTFVRDIGDNTAIKLLTVEIAEIKKLAFSRLEKHKALWEEDKEDYFDIYSNFKRIIWNQKHKFKIDKILEKNSATANFEFFMEYFSGFLRDFESQPSEVNASFIKVEFTNVKQAYINQCKEALSRIGGALLKLIEKKIEGLKQQIADYNFKMDLPTESLPELKVYLNLLREIRDATSDFDFRLADLDEKYGILHKYGLEVNIPEEDDLGVIRNAWDQLLAKSVTAERALKHKKIIFAEKTQQQVADLQVEVSSLHDNYFKTGPGCANLTLEEGIEKLKIFTDLVEDILQRKAELVNSQKLFYLEITTFPKLVEVEEDLKKLNIVYSFYLQFQKFIEEIGKTLWSKVDFSTLDIQRKEFLVGFKKIQQGNLNVHVIQKISTKLDEFSKALPVMERLKGNQNFKEVHWVRLLNEIGYTSKDINFKTITLQQAFEFKLQNFVEQVDDISNMAIQEGNNEEVLRDIETFWKSTSFDIVENKKQVERKRILIRVPEEVTLALNDHLVNLQNMEGSKFALSLKSSIRTWTASLNTIQETIETWISVQRKWMYLEGIFIGNEDIRQQLPKEVKNFENHHRAFRKINEQASKNSNIYTNCIQIESTIATLRSLAIDFDKAQKSLTDYLSSKRICFPRFYFISDDDLLSVLGSSESSAITPHLMKLFDNCKELKMEGGRLVHGMKSEEGEDYDFLEPVKIEGPVENWMLKVEQAMRAALRSAAKSGIFHLAKNEKKKWIEKSLGMVTLTATQVWWTWKVEDAFRRVREGDKHALKKELEQQTTDLTSLVELVRSDLEAIDPIGLIRKKINTLIIIEVHQRDIVDKFVRDSVLDVREFGWESQLRFYWQQTIDDLQVQQCTGKFSIGHEYQGLNGRLVITPLTDRCVMTLTTALTFHLGGAPAGPAGTGKTETCKDLAKSLARRCIVTNCGENFDALSMGSTFAGLCQSGFWGCFDEFNRINPEVLSVVSAQIRGIQNALSSNKKTVLLMGQEISLISTMGVFVTMNPGYEGRSELPDNLKALFRPVVMVVPDNNIICENMLMSEGFTNARPLAKKMTVLYKLAREQLSKQHHYDFGLRALKSVLVMAGALKRSSADISEEQVLMRALRDMNLPKFVEDDIRLFNGLISDLFPTLEVNAVSRQDLRLSVENQLQSENFSLNERQVQKAVQLFETMLTRHTTMVVGPTAVGKTTVIEALQKAQSVTGVGNAVIYPLDPKAQTLLELYGQIDSQTRDWTDGLLSKLFKIANDDFEDETSNKKRNQVTWILFDGDVDAVWVENMNSVMDDNKLLTLANGDRIRLKPTCKLLFEVADLQFASPATISRCGMVFVDDGCLKPSDVFASWARHYTNIQLQNGELLENVFLKLYEKFIPTLIDYLFSGRSPSKILESPFKFVINRSSINLVSQLTSLIGSLLPDTLTHLDQNAYESIFVFSIVWSFGSCIVPEHRERFSKSIKTLSSISLPEISLFDVVYEISDRNFFPWSKRLNEALTSSDYSKNSLLIPTTDTIRYSYLLKAWEDKGAPVLFVGDPGTSKTALMQNHLRNIDNESRTSITLNLSSRTSSLEVQRSIEALCDKRRPGLYCPKGGKKLLIFVDELHMPQKDKYNTQQPLALLRFLFSKGIMYERGGVLEKRKFTDLHLLSSLLPSSGGYNSVDPRFLTLFNCLGIAFPEAANVEKIYNTILLNSLDRFPEDCRGLIPKLTNATLKLYHSISERLPRTPIKFHYVFNLRDLSRIYQGLSRANLQYCSTPQSLGRLWRHECTRVFSDRLMLQADVSIFEEKVANAAATTFDSEFCRQIMEKQVLFCDFMENHSADSNSESSKLYREIESFAHLRQKTTEFLDQYNNENSGREMNLVLFSDAIEHLTKLLRVLGFPGGHSLLVGFGGSGKQSLAKLAAFIAGHQLVGINLKRNYKESHFREELLELFTKRFLSPQPVLFLINDNQIVEESFMELINTMLTVGVVTPIFDEAAKNEVRGSFRDMCKRETGKETGDEIWDFFCERVKNQLHIVLCMSPAGENLRLRCRNFPGLISSTSIDWFSAWPQEALSDVAKGSMGNFSAPEELKTPLQDHMVWLHSSLSALSDEFQKKTGRIARTTPKSFLDFLASFKRLFDEKQNQIASTISKYEIGLDKLQESGDKITILKQTIATEKEKVEIEKTAVEELLIEIRSKTEIATEKQITAKEKQEALAIENEEIKKGKEETDSILSEKLPALEVARQKVSEIKKSELDYIRSLQTPTKLIQMTVACLQILRVNANANENDGWAGAKTMLNDITLVNQLIEFSKDENKILKVTNKQIKLVEEKLNIINDELSEKQKTMNDVSPACAKLLCWVDAVRLLYETNQIIRPLRDKVERLTREKEKKEEALKETTALLSVLTTELAELNDRRFTKEKVLNELSEKVAAMEAKLFKAENLISDLGNERVRWGQDRLLLSDRLKYLHGESLLCASFISYAGPFDQEFRKKLLDNAKEDLLARKVPLPPNFNIQEALSSEIEAAIWNSQGLPNDELSIQNGILTTRASRYPLCLDPQLQALSWLKKREEKNLVITFFGDEAGFARSLETCLKFKKTLLVENVQDQIDPLLDPILEKNFVVRGTRKFVKLDNAEIEFFEKDFQLFMVTKIANPSLTPEIFGKTSVINYNVTFSGLKEQLLSEVVSLEQEEKEALRKRLISEMGENQKTLKNLEETLLTTLVSSQGSLLENEQLLSTLEMTKHNSTSIAQALKEGLETRKLLEEVRQAYIDVAKRGATLFFCMQKLSAVSEMYQYSLSSYLEVFRQSICEAKPESIQSARINNILDKLTHNVYDYVMLGLFEDHKLTFSFEMTIMLIEQEGKLNTTEYNFFIKGNTSFEEILEKKPLIWLSESSWKDLIFLSTLESFRGLKNSVLESQNNWKIWFDDDAPEEKSVPKPFDRLSYFQLLLILRIFRPDRVINGIKRFIIEYFKGNEWYVSSPTINFRKIFQQSNEKSAIVFILSPGADPIHDVQQLANNEGFGGNKFKSLSLGQNMEKEAEDLITGASQRGHWVMLQNCDLLPNWLEELEKLLENLVRGGKIAKDFRLWLTTKPTKAFPLGILQNVMKVVTEPPDGLRFNMRSIAGKLSDQQLAECSHPYFRPLSYVLCFFHSIVLDRRKFGKIGFNISYDFNESDFRISFKLLSMYLGKAQANGEDETPWESLKYLIGEAMYGGRVTDEYDRRVLTTYLDEYMGEFLFDADGGFCFAHSNSFNYELPSFDSCDALLSKINELPLLDSPTLFGLHNNSEITYFSNSAKSLWMNLLAMQSVKSGTNSPLENSETLDKVARDILDKIPTDFEVRRIRESFSEEMTPKLIFLLQELERFNIMLGLMRKSLSDLNRALKGEIVLNSDLESLSKSLLNGFLPDSWRRLCPQTQKGLASWISHFKRRAEQYTLWTKEKELNAFWLAGLHFPEAFLTALVQTTCRLNNWALDKSSLFTSMTTFDSPEKLTAPAARGCFVYGLFLEGAAWNEKDNCIVPQNPKQLVTELPIMQIIPIESSKLKMKDTMKVPVYVTQNRRNAAGVGHVFDADMATAQHVSHWILQGITIVLNTDD